MRKRDFGPGNSPEDYETLSERDKQEMAIWIKIRLAPSRRLLKPEKRWSSYGLKHHMEHETGLYVSNGQFKGGMQVAGYEAFDTNNINWTYNVRICEEQGEVCWLPPELR